MLTLDMMNLAKETRKIYVTGDLFYSKEDGFTDEDGNEWSGDNFETLNELMKLDDWEETDWSIGGKAMTKKEIENVLGYKINIVEE